MNWVSRILRSGGRESPGGVRDSSRTRQPQLEKHNDVQIFDSGIGFPGFPCGLRADVRPAVMRKGASFCHTILLIGVVILASFGCRRGTPGNVQTESANQPANSQTRETTGQVAVDKGDLKLRYQARKNSSAATSHTVGSHPEAIEKIISELNQRLILPFDMTVSFQDCEDPDAYYDPETHQITLCHQLIDDYYYLLSKRIKDKAKLDDAVKSAAAATFFHELGHGLVDAWKIPTTGREEDAVDQLSTLVLIERTENGEQMALDGALTFKIYGELTKGEKKIYWDEHSLDEQRFFDTICLVYGHDEEKFAYLVENGTLPEERAVFCTEDYDKVSHAWRQLLGPYLKGPAQSRPKLKLR
jgi:putative metallopeptidase DUF4344